MVRALTTSAPKGDVYELFTTEGNRTVITDEVGSGFPEPTVSRTMFVATWGNDTTGNGSLSAPYLTITAGLNAIVAAQGGGTDVWHLYVFPGSYAEGVQLRPWTVISGIGVAGDVEIDGIVQLSPTFGTPAKAWVKNVVIFGDPMTLDYIAAGSGALADVTFQQVNWVSSDVVLVQSPINSTLFIDCEFDSGYEQLCGSARWFGCAGAGLAELLRVAATAAGAGTLNMFNSCWLGDVHADQNGIAAGGVIVTINATNSELGPIEVTAVGANNPVVSCGDTADNPTLSGAASAALTRRMHVAQQLTIPLGTAIAATSTTDILLPLPAAALGATSIEDLVNNSSLVGADWGAVLTTLNCSVTFSYVNNAGVQEVHVHVWNPAAGFNTAANLTVNYQGYYPTGF